MSHLLYFMPEFVRTSWAELLCAALIVLIVPLLTGYIVLVERRVLAGVQERLGSHSLLQSIAAGIQLLLKEDQLPDGADRFIYWFAPAFAMTAAITSMGALAFGPWFQVGRDINIGLLFVVGVSALAPIGIVLGAWSPGNPHSIFGALRSTAQLISFQTAAAFALVSGFLLASTLKVSAIVQQQFADHAWFVFLAPAGFFIYFIATIVGMDRMPFDSPEAASDSADREQAEYGGFRSSLYSVAEYASVIVIASVGTTLFLGGWLRPFPNVHWLGWLDALPVLLFAALGAHWVSRAGNQAVPAQAKLAWAVALVCFAVALIFALAAPFSWAPLRILYPGLYGAFWFLLKVTAYIYIFLWLRFTLPRFRFEQLMRLGWHILVPLALVNVIGVGVALALQAGLGWNRWLAMLLTTALILFVALLLVRWNNTDAAAASANPPTDASSMEDSLAG
jgi:NADH-quinone oxidoreductase subunit H